MKWKVTIAVAGIIGTIGIGFFVPKAEAVRAKKLNSQVENHEFYMVAPEMKAVRLPFSTEVKGEVAKVSMLKCRDGVEETLNRLPDEVSSKLEVLILNFEGGERGLADSDTIILKCDVNKDERLRVFLHEMGHVAFLSSSAELQEEYKKIWEKSKDGDFVSGYAKENEFEDFSESFLAFVEFGESFRASDSSVMQEKYDFIEKNYFPNRVYNGDREDLGLTFDMTKL